MAQATVDHIVQMASAAAAAPASAAPMLPEPPSEELAAYTAAHSLVAARYAKRSMLEESVAAVAKMPKLTPKKPSKVALMILDADEANDQSGGQTIQPMSFAARRTPARATKQLALPAPPKQLALPAPPTKQLAEVQGVKRTVDKSIKLTPGRRAVK